MRCNEVNDCFIHSSKQTHTEKRMFNSSCCMRFFPVHPYLRSSFVWRAMEAFWASNFSLESFKHSDWRTSKFSKLNRTHTLMALVLVCVLIYTSEKSKTKMKKKLCKINGAWVISTHIERIYTYARTPSPPYDSTEWRTLCWSCWGCCVCFNYARIYKSDDAKNANRRANAHTRRQTLHMHAGWFIRFALC